MLSPHYEPLAPFENSARRAERTNMFVLATLVSEGVSNRVKIRNMSETGAMVEGPILPPAGAQVRLCRADTTIAGRVVWSRDKQAGVHFTSRAIVPDWLPSTNGGQRAVDQAVALAKAEKAYGMRPPAEAPLTSSAMVAQDLITMAALLDQLADDLSDDPAVIGKYMTRLQVLDVASQALRRLGRDHLG